MKKNTPAWRSPAARKYTLARIGGSARFNFWRFVKKMPSGCWLWVQSARGKYGNIWNGKKNEAAHRFAYRKFVKPIPKGLNVCHKCDNRKCVRPSHLYAASQGENLRDMYRKGRQGARNLPKGECHDKAKITNRDVRRIRRLYVSGAEKMPRLAAKYGVTLQNVWHIVHHKTWKHVA